MEDQSSGSDAGFALADVCVSLVILVVAMGGLLGTVFSALRLSEVNESTRSARQALHGILESMNALPFEEIFATCNSIPGDDPPANAGFRARLEIADAILADGEAGPAPVEIVFPTVQNGAMLELREDLIDPTLGMPRDLNGDGRIDALDHSGDYRILPVRVRLVWRGPSGQQELQLSTILADRDA